VNATIKVPELFCRLFYVCGAQSEAPRPAARAAACCAHAPGRFNDRIGNAPDPSEPAASLLTLSCPVPSARVRQSQDARHNKWQTL